jgi:DNA polymerase-3 subunit alpha
LYEREGVGFDKKTVNVIAYDKHDAEYLGMLKADFLGLSTMGMISLALDFIGMDLDALYRTPLDDPETIAAFNRADVIGIFQFEGRATRIMTMDVKPSSFMEIADINALSRPGPLFSGASATYTDIKHGRAKPEHLHPIVDKYTSSTNYQIIYQEQVLAILREMGGFPASFTGALRKVISLKLGEAQFNEFRPRFINGAKEHHGISEELADRIWRLMVTSATYSFNIAHCISYGMLAYWCMWLKVHHPVEFYAAQLIKTPDADKQGKLIKDAERHGVKVLPPAMDVSGSTWRPDLERHAVVAGFSQIPGVGDKTADTIVDWLDEQDRSSVTWEGLTAVKGIGTVRMNAIKEFAESDDPWGLNRTREVLAALRNEMQADPGSWPLIPTYTSNAIPREHQGKIWVVWMGFPRERNYQDYIENQRSRTGEEVEDIMRRAKRKDLLTSCVLRCYDDEDEEVYLRFNRFVYPKFKDALERLSLGQDNIVIAAGTKHHAFGISVAVEHMMVVNVG